MVLATVCVLVVAPAAAQAALLTFDDYVVGTQITNQYAGQGVLFSGENGELPEIAFDSANDTSPVLRGGEDFFEPLHALFVYPGTASQATAESVSFDLGYIDDPGSSQVVFQTTSGPVTVSVVDEGIDRIGSPVGGVTGFSVESTGFESNGLAIDNLSFSVDPPPAPAPPPASPSCPKYAVIDSRGSGEDRNQLSKPGVDFIRGFKAKLSGRSGSKSVSWSVNPYPAVGVFSAHPSQLANGIGALLDSDKIGAYHASVRKGELELRKLVLDHAASTCGRMNGTVTILLGYSQGAQVTGDVYQSLSPAQQERIDAVVLWGDPLYNHDDDLADHESRAYDGALGTRHLFPHGEARVFSYCNTHDPVCQGDGLPADQFAWYLTKEHSLYWKTKQAENDGGAVAAALTR